MAFSRCLSLVLTMIVCLDHVSGEMKVILNAAANKLVFKETGIATGSSYDLAVDGKTGQNWGDCAASQSSTPTIWLSIDLLHLYSVTKIRFLTRHRYGRGIEVYVGKDAIDSDGITNHQCGSSVTIPSPAPSTFTDFSCSPINWVQYVSIRRHGQDDGAGDLQYLQPCEIEVYYDETEDPGITITKNAAAISKLDVTQGDIVLCGSPKGDFGPTWKFPNGTDVPEQNSATISQADGSSGYKELRLSPLTSIPPNGQYKCHYTANNIAKTKTVDLTFTADCQVSSWSACSSSCGRGTRTRTITLLKVGTGQDCPSPLSEDCANTNCGQIDMKAIGAVATHGPLDTIDSRLQASLAIDGVTNTGCAATNPSMDPWLRVDLKTAYLISSVETSFYGDRGNGAVVRIGSDLTNDGNNNLLCGTVPNRNNGKTIWTTTIVCSPSLWGRYINVQKIFPNNFYLSLCELKANYELDVGILYNDSSVASGSIFVYGGDALSFPVLCGVNPDSTNLNSLLNIQWKSGNSPISSSNSDVRQSTDNKFTSLHIGKAPSTDTTYTCQYTWIDNKQKTLQFNLNINVDCGWSTWLSCSGPCGVGTRLRTADNPVKKHQGKDCVGDLSEDCDIGKAPCAPTPVRNSISVQEGLPAALECEATQFRLIQTPITFEWFKSGVQIVNPSNSSTRSLGNGKYKGTLTLTSVRKADANSYTCRASGHSGLSAASLPITLDVTYAPFNVRVQANSSWFVKEQSLILNCSAKANPKPSQYKWYKDGQIITGETGSQISFSSLDYDNSGKYNCTAINSIGEAQSSGFVIVVRGKCFRPPAATPTPPVELKLISKTFESLFLTWKSPLNPNGIIRAYRLYYWMLDESEAAVMSVESISSSFNLTGLRAYTRYQINVTAINNADAFPESSPGIITNETLITAPERPQFISNPLDELEISSNGIVRFSAPFISDEKVPVSYIKVFIYSGLERPPPLSVPPRESEMSELWHAAAFFDYTQYNKARNHFTIGSGNRTFFGDTTYTDSKLERNARYSIYFVAYLINEIKGVHLESSSGPTSFYTSSSGECEAATSNPSGGSSFGVFGIAFLILFVITFIALVVLLVMHIRQRQILKKSYPVERHAYELPIKSEGKLEGDIIPHRMTESSVYGVSSVKHQSEGEQVYAEVCDKEKEANK
ncbi:uncharacterized protein [Oscarella lobularis]|uniref:uncharacterized protein isoform X2 n=1 Tax=Oscarella lobularis TaxID=121494 RepID=UPI00331316B7